MSCGSAALEATEHHRPKPDPGRGALHRHRGDAAGNHQPGRGARARFVVAAGLHAEEMRQRHAHNYSVYGRLKPGVTLAQARAEMDVIARRMAEADAQNVAGAQKFIRCTKSSSGNSRRLLLVLLGSVGLGPAHRLRQHRQPAAGAFDGAGARVRHSRGARRRTRRLDSPVAHGKLRAGRNRWRLGNSPGAASA